MNRERWRLEMTEFVIQKWKKCTQILKNQPHTGKYFAGEHYSGNFWWATIEYIRNLQCPIKYAKSNKLSRCKLRQSPYYSAEFVMQ